MPPKDNSPFAADQARIARENEEQLARTENVQPTPTQAENDRAKLGVDSLDQLDNKEPDGSAEQGAAPAPTPTPAPTPAPKASDGKA